MQVAQFEDSWVLKGHAKLTPAVSEFVTFVWTLKSIVCGQNLTITPLPQKQKREHTHTKKNTS